MAAGDLKNVPGTRLSMRSPSNPPPSTPDHAFPNPHRRLLCLLRPRHLVTMNGLGVGGSQSPNIVNAANALLYAFMTVTCFLGPFLTNLVGFRYTLSLGSIGYPLYAAGLYLNNRTGVTWLVYLGFGAIATGYPEDRKRGRYIATWFTFRNFGNIIGGAISLGINANHNKRGQVGFETYLGFIAIQCLGCVIGLLLPNPEKVTRDDGTKIATNTDSIHWKTEAKAMWKRGKSKPILLLTPLFWYFGWVQAYPGTYLAMYFTVRSRVLGCFLSAIVGTTATWLGGSLVDIPWTSNRKHRALATWALIAALNSATWIWAVIIQNEYRHTNPRLSVGIVENYIYWCIGNLSDSPGFPAALIVTAGINFGLWFLALPVSFWATKLVVGRFEEAVRDDPVL
ncbi:hypothetical protein BDW66DRAFT_159052 [Aspergillus desertorum]